MTAQAAKWWDGAENEPCALRRIHLSPLLSVSPATTHSQAGMPSERPAVQAASKLNKGSAGGGFIFMQGGVLGDADHGEDLLEVGAEAEGMDLLSLFAGGDHHLNY